MEYENIKSREDVVMDISEEEESPEEVRLNEDNESSENIDEKSDHRASVFSRHADDEIEFVGSEFAAVPSRINSEFPIYSNSSVEGISHPVVLVMHENVPVVAINKLKEKFNVVIIENQDTPEIMLEKAFGVSAIFHFGNNIQKIDREFLDFIGDKLKVVGLMGSGYEGINVRELMKRKIKIGITQSVSYDSVAEMALCLALAVAHRFKEGYLSCFKKNAWVTDDPDWILGKQLSGSACGIVGFGDLGRAIALRLSAFRVKRIMFSGHRKDLAENDSKTDFVEFTDLLTDSDFIFIACPLTNDTKHIFNYQTFQLMKPTCVLVNVGRGGKKRTDGVRTERGLLFGCSGNTGEICSPSLSSKMSNAQFAMELPIVPVSSSELRAVIRYYTANGKSAVVKTDDLVKALQERLILGAGLDVTDPQSLPPNHPLIYLDNCFVTPEIGSATLTTREATALLTADNIIAALEGSPMPGEVCFKAENFSRSSVLYEYRVPRRYLAKHTLINVSNR